MSGGGVGVGGTCSVTLEANDWSPREPPNAIPPGVPPVGLRRLRRGPAGTLGDLVAAEKLGEVSDGVDHGPELLRGGDRGDHVHVCAVSEGRSVGGGLTGVVHEAEAARGPGAVGPRETVHQHAAPPRERRVDEGEERVHEG